MFGLGWDHLVVIFVVAMVVFGPGELPNVMRQLGRTMKTVNKVTGDFRKQFEDAVRDAEKELDLKDARAAIQDAMTGTPLTPDRTVAARDSDEKASTIAQTSAAPAAAAPTNS
ncbi:twin-arginine translocase TatA/TatE family subunit [Mesorhizobium sp. PAMC28654]|uniref:Sec-independent protein translocase subunit TatA/TatB n=1 Tax=Mesorhizobium sp. PAMC28654 TaxID=2880934 RepID=UPI001D09B4A2|nr:twin-arginine translocase TatA/TatE family subunit [Mesorhizobium sp. PAMC28654]UDL89001.1 twin-arginine translocase TatA/TatE family subunit [Mesorhizobium sp. PAMC28654]